MSERPIMYYFAFCAWLVVCIPFSVWKGGSFGLVTTYLRTVAAISLVIPGLVMDWRESKRLMQTLVAGSVISALLTLAAVRTGGDRLSMDYGTLGNSNDIAAHTIMLMPFLLYLAFSPSISPILRALAWPTIVVSLYIILGSGSRGALIGLLLASLMILWRLSAGQRIAALIVSVALVVGIASLVPSAFQRAASFFSQSAVESQEAMESRMSRKRLLERSIELAIANPLFGVGPAQFMSAENDLSQQEGLRRGMWHGAHNSFTNIMAEAGFPALFFFLAGIVGSFWMAGKALKLAASHRGGPGEFKDITLALQCYRISALSTYATIFFLNFSYFFHVPVLIGLGVALSRATRHELASVPMPAPTR
jgi:hypothetical protein